jgi:hypothetical protein
LPALARLSAERGSARIQDLPAVAAWAAESRWHEPRLSLGHRLEVCSSSRPRRTPGCVSGSPVAVK